MCEEKNPLLCGKYEVRLTAKGKIHLSPAHLRNLSEASGGENKLIPLYTDQITGQENMLQIYPLEDYSQRRKAAQARREEGSARTREANTSCAC